MSRARRWIVPAARLAGIALALLLAALGVWALVPAGTRPIHADHAIAELRSIELGGFPQTVLLRGDDARNPVLLYLHGGPGGGQLPLARQYSGALERHFVVAHWDQRGAGASCAGVDWSTVSLERIVADTIELAERLGRGNRIFLIGHSWGSLVGVLAVQRRPDLFYAYVGTGQLVHRDRQEQISYDWVVARAREAGDRKAIEELSTIRPPYRTQGEFSLERRWLSRYHGDVFAVDSERRFLPATLFGREYTLATRLRYQSCFDRSLETLLRDRLDVDLLSRVRRLDVPVFLLVGRRDYNTPGSLVEEWASRLSAPHVEVVPFDNAGHFLAVEAPDELQARLIEKLLPLARG